MEERPPPGANLIWYGAVSVKLLPVLFSGNMGGLVRYPEPLSGDASRQLRASGQELIKRKEVMLVNRHDINCMKIVETVGFETGT